MSETAIFARKVIVGPARHVIEHAAVLTSGRTIRAVGRAHDIEQLVTPNTTRLNYPEATIMPGLIDSHVHLSFDSSSTPFASLERLIATGSGALLELMAGHARQLLAGGVTTARDLGDRDGLAAKLRDQIQCGVRQGPRLVVAGTPLTCPGGHCAFLGGEVGTKEEIVHRIAANRDAGADLIKVMASGGALSPGGPPMWAAQFSGADLAHIVRTAESYGLPVAAHAHGTTTIQDCVDAGVRTIEHCSWRDGSGLRYDQRIAEDLAGKDIAVCRCVSGDWQLFLRQLGANAAPLVKSIQRMREAEVRFIAGTDAGVPGAGFGDYTGMLGFFADTGFSVHEVLDMATIHAAVALNLDDVGALKPGYSADLLVVHGDPMARLADLGNLDLVMVRGEVVKPH